jgi:hypothetical protein
MSTTRHLLYIRTTVMPFAHISSSDPVPNTKDSRSLAEKLTRKICKTQSILRSGKYDENSLITSAIVMHFVGQKFNSLSPTSHLILTAVIFREFNEETANLFETHLETMKDQLSNYFPKNAVYIRSGARLVI